MVDDLQHLSKREEVLPLPKGSAPLAVFKNEYRVLFESLHAVFGLMMSNSRLCEQILGMLRYGPPVPIRDGLDRYSVTHAVRHGYLMKQLKR